MILGTSGLRQPEPGWFQHSTPNWLSFDHPPRPRPAGEGSPHCACFGEEDLLSLDAELFGLPALACASRQVTALPQNGSRRHLSL
jgi:hypothetical protein